MAKRKRTGGNPAKQSWDPIEVIQCMPPGASAMTRAFFDSGGERHFYQYRNPQRAVNAIAFRNRLYNGFGLVFEDGSMHLSYKRNDRAAIYDWRHIQAIKNEVAGPDREAIQIFPPEWNLKDGANEYHLFVLPPDQGSPLGLGGGFEVVDEVDTTDHAADRQRGYTIGTRQQAWEEGIPTGLGQADGEA
jgi:hypothetical protein